MTTNKIHDDLEALVDPNPDATTPIPERNHEVDGGTINMQADETYDPRVTAPLAEKPAPSTPVHNPEYPQDNEGTADQTVNVQADNTYGLVDGYDSDATISMSGHHERAAATQDSPDDEVEYDAGATVTMRPREGHDSNDTIPQNFASDPDRASTNPNDTLTQARDATLATPKPKTDVTQKSMASTQVSADLRYHALRPLAKGGLGEVLIAQDQELNREVALKEIQPQFADNTGSRERFLLEAEVTGGLEHPGIVPVYGLGHYSDGRPYYAMRLIRGDSLSKAIARFHGTETADAERVEEHEPKQKSQRETSERRLGLRKLLGHFIDVCNAIHYAHSRGVLHRDLKPDNVMLGDYGETLVVDWGLAKVSDSNASDSEDEQPNLTPTTLPSSATMTGSVMGTPTYMSPEQAAGATDQLGPASDIYSLGAMLYCLLTGQSAVAGVRSLTEILERVKTGNFPAPRDIKPQTPTALNAVCLKAMALKAEDRYASAKELAEDIEHWLADEPVVAWREPITVRTGRWIRRHKPLVTGILTAVLALAVGGALWSNAKSRLQEQAEEQVIEALGKVRQLHAAAEQADYADSRPWRAALDMAIQAKNLAEDGLVSKSLLDRTARWNADLQKTLNEKLVLHKLRSADEKKSAIDLVNQEFTNVEALPIYREVFAELGLVFDKTSAEEATQKIGLYPKRFQEALIAMMDDWVRSTSAPLKEREWILSLVVRADQESEIRNKIRQATKLRRADILIDITNQPGVLEEKPLTNILLAKSLRRVGQREVGIALLQRVQQQHPSDFEVNLALGMLLYKASQPRLEEALHFFGIAQALRPKNVGVLMNLSGVLRKLGRIQESISASQKAVVLKGDWAYVRLNLTNALISAGQFKEAERECRKTLGLDEKLPGTHFTLGKICAQQDRAAEAITHYQDAVDLRPDLVQAHNGLGLAFSEQGKLDEAIEAFKKAIQFGPEQPIPHNNYGLALKEKGRFEEAIEQYRKAIEIDPKFVGAYTNMGIAYKAQRKYKEAAELYRKAISLDPSNILGHANLGVLLQTLGQTDEATEQYLKVLEIKPDQFEANLNMGRLREKSGHLEDATRHFKKAIATKPNAPLAHCFFGQTLQKSGQFVEALEMFKRGHELGKRMRRWPYPTETWVLKASALVQLEDRLDLYLEGEGEPIGVVERVALATKICVPKRMYMIAVKLCMEAFTEDASLLEKYPNRYNAACWAALAASGKGVVADSLDESKRAILRKQSMRWLHSELEHQRRRLVDGSSSIKADARKQLKAWQADADLASLREADGLRLLPKDELKTCLEFWSNVEGLAKE